MSTRDIIKEEPSSGVKPRSAKGYLKRASGEQNTKAWKFTGAMLAVPPTARPFTATMEGFGKSQNAKVIAFNVYVFHMQIELNARTLDQKRRAIMERI